MRPWSILGAMLAVAGVAEAGPAPLSAYMEQARVQADATVRYGSEPSQVVELFLPEGQGPHPVVVLLHGGCYRQAFEGLPQTSGIAADLARRGLAVWNVEYRRLGEAGAGYPGTFQDVAAAIDRIRDEAGRHDLDPGRVVAVGHSAGGHLALWAAARHRLPKDSPLSRPDPVRIRAVVSLAGIGDLEGQGDVFSRACGADTFPQMLGDPRRLADTSPAELLPTGARVVMVHGAYDHVMPPFTGLEYVGKARAAGDAAEVVTIPDAGHFDVVIPTTAAWGAVADLVTRVARDEGS
ncbi:alpha/beta hydrolase family protein [Phenylobacterium sp.]|uniref:alpha/beta hydrolase family protein n=1 Tax=Phenylobacterium sp. TaxID=1871053 RepID=UPI002FDF98AF